MQDNIFFISWKIIWGLECRRDTPAGREDVIVWIKMLYCFIHRKQLLVSICLPILINYRMKQQKLWLWSFQSVLRRTGQRMKHSCFTTMATEVKGIHSRFYLKWDEHDSGNVNVNTLLVIFPWDCISTTSAVSWSVEFYFYRALFLHWK